jgi:polysaccharide pyruvyl transferase WcaK-like protein
MVQSDLHILIDPVGYEAHNLGDVAMRQVAARRLRAMWPDATIQMVLKDDPQWQALVPEVVPLDVRHRRAWFYPALPDHLLRRLPPRLAQRLRAVERGIRHRWPRTFERVVRLKRRLRGRPENGSRVFLDALLKADLVFVSGVGAINDHFGERILDVFELLSHAIRQGTPTVMMGQGIGPLHEGPTLSAARRVLPRVDLIGVREGVMAGPLLASLGVRPSQVAVTGDDAVELAYEARRDGSGTALGLNVRVAGYVVLTDRDLDRIAEAIEPILAGQRESELLAVPTSRHQGEPDLDAIRGVANRIGVTLAEDSELETPEAAVERIGLCRLVVSGSYHAALFALGQGIPAVCLAANAFYAQKFIGLANLFGTGCTVVDFTADGGQFGLGEAVARQWSAAPAHREELLLAAQTQIQEGHSAYARIQELVESRR